MSIDKKTLIAQIGKNIVPAKQSPAPEPAKVQQEAATVAVLEAPKKAPARAPKQEEPLPATGAGTGKQAAFWLDDEDRALFHECGMLLYSQGIKPSHNLVLRAALRLVPRDHRLTEKVRELLAQDGRKLRHQRGGE